MLRIRHDGIALDPEKPALNAFRPASVDCEMPTKLAERSMTSSAAVGDDVERQDEVQRHGPAQRIAQSAHST
ncbi:hypothetical protein AOQ73_12460 [Bradyrhizobium pachyrhizi]|nr:hypothetical protein AOQ73_12460 [Bradyrhizobium pachyrhizi]